MARTTKIPPIFENQNTEHVPEYPSGLDLPDNVPFLFQTNSELEQTESENGDHGRTDAMPVVANHGDLARFDYQPAPPAASQADGHAELDLPRELSGEEAGEETAGSDSVSHSESVKTEKSAEASSEASSRGAENDRGDRPDEMPAEAKNGENGRESRHTESEGQQADQPEGRENGERSQNPDATEQTESSESNDETEGSESGEGFPFAPTTGDQFLGLPMIYVEEFQPSWGGDEEEASVFEDFL